MASRLVSGECVEKIGVTMSLDRWEPGASVNQAQNEMRAWSGVSMGACSNDELVLDRIYALGIRSSYAL